MSHRTALAPVKFGVLALALVATAAVACSAQAGSGAWAAASSGAAADAAPAAQPGASPDAAALDEVTSDARARLDAALNALPDSDRKPGTEQIRSVLIDAGFPSSGVEVTASRTPTGLDADAVEAAVITGRNCIVAQLRDGTVTSAVLPVLADGRCLVGTAG